MSQDKPRILIIDDQQSIHDDFEKILGGDSGSDAGDLADMRAAFFGAAAESKSTSNFSLVHALQGQEGVDIHHEASDADNPFAVAFVDIRMPPGLDGVQTIAKLWEADSDLQTVICTAYSDYSFEDIVENLGQSDRLLILKKPFDPVEVRQLAEALTAKWESIRAQKAQLHELERKNKELSQAEKAAKAASRAKSQFLTNMSHEIRTPLNAMLGFVDFVCDGDISAEDREKYERTIKESGDHLMRLLDEVLDLARVEARRIDLSRNEINPLELAREVGWTFMPQASDKDLKLGLEVLSALPQRFVNDASRIKQILIQLVGNAVKFTQTGEIVLELEASEDEMRWTVADTGPGIPEDQQKTVFDAFHQADNSLTRESGGLGLGLALVQRIAGYMGGRVTLESTPGQGSRFTLHLPTNGACLVDVPSEQRSLERRVAVVNRPEVPDSLDCRVLIVEDVKLNRLLLSKILRKAGASIEAVENGLEGVEAVRRAHAEGQPFDLVLMDMQMPVMDGYTATETLRQEGIQVPVVALTAHAMKGDRERCIEAGCDDYATKPIDRVALVELCGELLRDKGRKAA